MGYEVGDDSDYQTPGVNYKDHQLIRITPVNEKQVQYLEDLKEGEPDDIRFWTFPAENRCDCTFTTFSRVVLGMKLSKWCNKYFIRSKIM